MPYDARLQNVHPFAMSKEQLEQEAEHIRGTMTQGEPDTAKERRLAMIKIAGDIDHTILDHKAGNIHLLSDVDMSPAMHAELARLHDEHQTNIGWANEYRQARGITEGDHRDFAAMVEYEDGMTSQQKKEMFTEYMEDYYSGDPARRKKCLDNFYDRMDSIDPLTLDLSCISRPGMTGDGSGTLTASERDVIRLFDRFRNGQTYTVKSEVENREYTEQRYTTPQAKAKRDFARDIVNNGFMPYLSNGLMAYNEVNQNLAEAPGMRGVMDVHAQDHITEAIDKLKLKVAVLEGIPYQQSIQSAITAENASALARQPIKREADGSFDRTSANLLGRIHSDIIFKSESDINQSNIRQELGIKANDMIFIDGVSVTALYADKFKEMSEEQRSKRIQQEVAAAALTGQHRFDYATLHTDATGAYKTVISPIEIDLHAMDAQEKSKRSALRRAFDFGPFKIKTTADQQDALQKSDPDRETRQKAIEVRLGADITAAVYLKHDIDDRMPSKTREQLAREAQPYRSPETEAALEPAEREWNRAKKEIDDIGEANRPLKEQIALIDADQMKAENYSRAARHLTNINRKLEGMQDIKDDDRDITMLDMESLRADIPMDTSKEGKALLYSQFGNQLMPSFREFEFCGNNVDTPVDKLTQQLEEEKKAQEPNAERIKLLQALVDAPDRQGREAVKAEYLKTLKANLGEYIDAYSDVLDTHPNKALAAPEKMEERKLQMAELRGQMQAVPRELQDAAVVQEAKVKAIYDERHIIYDNNEIPRPDDFVPPKTPAEALERIAAIDGELRELEPFMTEKEKVMKAKSFFMGGATEPANHLKQQEVQDFLAYINKLDIDTGSLSPEVKEAYQAVRGELETIATQDLNAPMCQYLHLQELGGTVVTANTMAIGQRPEFVRLQMDGQHTTERYSDLETERRELLKDYRSLQREAEKQKPEAQVQAGEPQARKVDVEIPHAEAEIPHTEHESTHRQRESMDLSALTREAREAGELPSINRQRSQSLTTEEIHQQTRTRSLSEAERTEEKKAPEKGGGKNGR